jgi:hypothetical protein
LRALAVSDITRYPHLPDVPTFKELGYNVEMIIWFGMLAPKGTPKEVIDRLYGAQKKAFDENKLQPIIEKIGMIPFLRPPEEMDKIIQEDHELYTKAAKDAAAEDRPSVQIGDPFTEKLIIDATLEMAATGKVHSCKDLGAAGLAGASSEMCSSFGALIHAEKVHLREKGMRVAEIMLSESQERMLFAVNPKGLDKVLKIFDKYDLPYSVVGEVTSTGELVIKRDRKIVAHMKPELLADAPVILRKAKRPAYVTKLRKIPKPPSTSKAGTGKPRGLSGGEALAGMADVLARVEIDHVLGDVGGVVGDPLQTAADDDQVNSPGNGFGLGHHVGEQLPKNLIIQGIDLIVSV